jgi:hypothetical protein
MPRFILLEHSGVPDDPAGRHYDLLLEEGAACRTWRLAEIPSAGGTAVAAVEIAPHRLAWLDHEAGEVSGGRGFARRVDGGPYELIGAEGETRLPAESIRVRLGGERVSGLLVIDASSGRGTARLGPERPGAACRSPE